MVITATLFVSQKENGFRLVPKVQILEAEIQESNNDHRKEIRFIASSEKGSRGSFKGVFEEAKQLPPCTKIDHKKQIERMLKMKIINPRNSPYSIPIILVKKKYYILIELP